MSSDRWMTACLWMCGVMGLLRSLEGDNVAPAVWACAVILLLILRELIDREDDTTS